MRSTDPLQKRLTDSAGRHYVVPLEQIPWNREGWRKTSYQLPPPALYDAQGQLLWEGSPTSFPQIPE